MSTFLGEMDPLFSSIRTRSFIGEWLLLAYLSWDYTIIILSKRESNESFGFLTTLLFADWKSLFPSLVDEVMLGDDSFVHDELIESLIFGKQINDCHGDLDNVASLPLTLNPFSKDLVMIFDRGPILSRLIPDVWSESVDFLLIEDVFVLICDNSNEFPETILDCFFLVIREPLILEIQFVIILIWSF